MLRDANPDSFSGIYIVCGRTDMRYGMDTLAALLRTDIIFPCLSPNTLFLFCDGKSNKIKGLLCEGDGFLLLTKRVEVDRFTWSRSSEEVRYLSLEQFRRFIQGFNIDPPIKDTNPK